MAHLAKFGAAEFGRLYAHWAREKDSKGEYITYRDEKEQGGHIHRDMTQQNYTIGEIHDRSWVKTRLQGVYQKPNQKRPVQSCDIIVTLPKTESNDPETVRQFMQAAYDSLTRMYGQHNNTIGCWVHLDEAQPHLHYAFLPIAKRRSRQKPEYTEKLSTRAYWSKKSALQDMHKTLQADISVALGHPVEITNGATKAQGGNKTIGQLKAETKALQTSLETSRARSQKDIESVAAKEYRPLIGSNYYRLSPDQYARLRQMAQSGLEQRTEYERMKQENERLAVEVERLHSRMRGYKGEVEERLRAEISSVRAKNAEAQPYLSVPPALRQTADRYLDYARQDVAAATAEVARRAAVDVLRGEKPLAVSKKYATALTELGIEVSSGFPKAAAEAMKAQMKGKAPKASGGTWQPSASQIDYKAPDADPSILSGVLSAQAMASLHMDVPDEIQEALEMGDWERVAELMEQKDLWR